MENLGNIPIHPPDSGNGNEYTRSLAGYQALKGDAALVPHSSRTVLRLGGGDPVGMLNAVITNDMPRDGNIGTYAALLNPKGRIQTDLRVLRRGDDILVVTEEAGTAAAKEALSRYAPFSRVKLEDLSEDKAWGVLGLYGPRAGELLGGLELTEHETAEIEVGGARVLTVGVAVPVPGFELLSPADVLRTAGERLLSVGAELASLDAYETIRIEVGIPRFGLDISPENFPAEVGILERAVSFSKGCYPGQETVARMHYRGHPNKTLHRLVATDTSLSPGAPILQDGRQVGSITSTAPFPLDGRFLALGYLSRSAIPAAPLQAGSAAITLA
ncbi:MAG: hypothetical protein M3305_08515 [Actinomycetota bacterium]|nr:hypothetical protein [Actinomycetota bacterium]